MNLKNVKVPAGGKLFKIHNYTYLVKGHSFHLEVDEFHDGSFSGHGEHSTDKNFYIETVSGKSVEDCLTQLLEKISTRIGS